MRRYTYQHVNMIRVCFCLYNLNVLCFTQFPEYLTYICLQFPIDLLTSVFRRKHYVIFTIPFRV